MQMKNVFIAIILGVVSASAFGYSSLTPIPGSNGSYIYSGDGQRSTIIREIPGRPGAYHW